MSSDEKLVVKSGVKWVNIELVHHSRGHPGRNNDLTGHLTMQRSPTSPKIEKKLKAIEPIGFWWECVFPLWGNSKTFNVCRIGFSEMNRKLCRLTFLLNFKIPNLETRWPLPRPNAKPCEACGRVWSARSAKPPCWTPSGWWKCRALSFSLKQRSTDSVRKGFPLILRN